MHEVFDGFNSHVISQQATLQRLNMKNMVLKKEGDASHINQAYDNLFAKIGKSAKWESLRIIRSGFQVTKTIAK
jgi:hypothetical protein